MENKLFYPKLQDLNTELQHKLNNLEQCKSTEEEDYEALCDATQVLPELDARVAKARNELATAEQTLKDGEKKVEELYIQSIKSKDLTTQAEAMVKKGKVKWMAMVQIKDMLPRKHAPSGYLKPVPISKELCNFLKCDYGTQISRPKVVKFLTKYISENKLQDPIIRRRILCDSALSELFSLGSEDEVTYFNLYKYMKPHFLKPGVSV
jgi:chromatin remodeling complex protein RSC6